MKRIISILIENKSGALARVVGLFHQRGYNIETLNVGPVFDGSYSRMSVTTRGSENDVEQKKKQKILKSLNGKIHEKNQDIMVMSAWGSSSEIELAIKAMGKVNILEIARSGSIGLHEGEKVLKI